jgi:hypothetical protein
MKFVFDLDGTICFHGRPVSETILAALEHLAASGHEVVFASARPIRDLIPVLHERFHHYPMVGGNGSFIAAGGRIVSTASFDGPTLARLTELIRAYRASYLMDGEWDYSYKGPDDHPILRNLDPWRRARNVGMEHLHPVVKLVILDSDDMEAMERRVSNLPVVVHRHGNEGILDVSPKGIDKWSGLEKLGVREGEFVAFGNDANDISMFRRAAYSVMIGDHAQLKQYASEQIALDEFAESRIAQRLKELAAAL